MKVLLCITVLLALALAEPPRYRQQNQQQRQYYFARQQEETTLNPSAAAPYPPSGWKPAGPTFELPQRFPKQEYGPPPAANQQYGPPSAASNQQYGPPSAASNQQYGPPSTPPQQYGAPVPPQQYGPAQVTTTELPTTTDFEEQTTTPPSTEPEAEPVNSVNELEEDDEVEEQPQESGEYYVSLPDGRLQRIRYVSRQDTEAMKYFAKIRAENVEPLRGPIYAYAPLQKLQVFPGNLQVAPISPKLKVAPLPEKLTVADASSANSRVASAKLELQPAAVAPPMAAQVQYQYQTSSSLVSPGTGLSFSSPYTTFAANYQTPTASDPRYFLTFQ